MRILSKRLSHLTCFGYGCFARLCSREGEVESCREDAGVGEEERGEHTFGTSLFDVDLTTLASDICLHLLIEASSPLAPLDRGNHTVLASACAFQQPNRVPLRSDPVAPRLVCCFKETTKDDSHLLSARILVHSPTRSRQLSTLPLSLTLNEPPFSTP